MGTNIPETIPGLMNWATQHGTQWKLNAVNIGLTAAQATAYDKLAQDLVAANAAAETARQASKDATLQLRATYNKLRTQSGSFVNTIKSFAETSGNTNVYSLAGISPESPRGTVPPPIPPREFAAGVNADGSLTIKFKVTQPTGVSNVSYLIYRRLNGQTTAPYALVGTADKKTFVDTTLPVGVDKVEYIIQPKRGSVSGAQSDVFSVQFGSIAGGPGVAITAATSIPHEKPVKLAA